MTEAKIIQGCKSSDRPAQRALYDRYAEQVYRTALRITRDRDAAFDVTQDTFLQAFGGIGSFDGRATLATWLYRIAVNQALQLLRRHKTERRHLRIVAEQSPTATEPADNGAYPDVESALAALSEHDRAILVLKYQEGLSYDEIAASLDCAPGTVASRLNRARDRLRRIMAELTRNEEESGRVSHQTE